MQAVPALISGGVSLLGGFLGRNAAKDAASQQAAAVQRAIDYTRGISADQTQRMQPFLQGGQQALTSLLGFYGLPGGNAGGATEAFNQFAQTPAYQFPLQQGQLALQRMLSSTGLLGSPGALRDALQLNQGYASQGLQGYLSGLSGLTNLGAGTGNSLGNFLASMSGQMGNLYPQAGNAQAGGTVGGTNAMLGGLNNFFGALNAPGPRPDQQPSALQNLITSLSSSSYGTPSSNGLA